jgi:FAD/FMN-containing dehydrogenase
VLSGLIVYPIAEAKSVLQRYRAFIAQAPEDLTVWAVMRQAPPLPFLPKEVHGKGMIALALIYAGEPTEGEPLIAPLRKFGTPLGEHVGVQPYVAWQQAFDPLLTAGARNYWKSHNFTTLADGLFDTVIAAMGTLPSPQTELFLGALGGAASRPAPDATAYAPRDAQFVMNVHGRWENLADDKRCIAWARDFFKAAAPFASGSVYVNFLTADEGERVRAAYGPNYDRLARVKRTYDPDNLFRMNHNIKPA